MGNFSENELKKIAQGSALLVCVEILCIMVRSRQANYGGRLN